MQRFIEVTKPFDWVYADGSVHSVPLGSKFLVKRYCTEVVIGIDENGDPFRVERCDRVEVVHPDPVTIELKVNPEPYENVRYARPQKRRFTYRYYIDRDHGRTIKKGE